MRVRDDRLLHMTALTALLGLSRRRTLDDHLGVPMTEVARAQLVRHGGQKFDFSGRPPHSLDGGGEARFLSESSRMSRRWWRVCSAREVAA